MPAKSLGIHGIHYKRYFYNPYLADTNLSRLYITSTLTLRRIYRFRDDILKPKVVSNRGALIAIGKRSKCIRHYSKRDQCPKMAIEPTGGRAFLRLNNFAYELHNSVHVFFQSAPPLLVFPGHGPFLFISKAITAAHSHANSCQRLFSLNIIDHVLRSSLGQTVQLPQSP